MWDNFGIIIQIIDSRIDFIYHTTDLYDSQFFSRKDEDCLLQPSHFIRYLLQIDKPLGFGYELK